MAEPEDPLTLLAAVAAQMHELFVSLVNAGFDKQEALQIVIGVATGGGTVETKKGPQPPSEEEWLG